MYSVAAAPVMFAKGLDLAGVGRPAKDDPERLTERCLRGAALSVR